MFCSFQLPTNNHCSPGHNVQPYIFSKQCSLSHNSYQCQIYIFLKFSLLRIAILSSLLTREISRSQSSPLTSQETGPNTKLLVLIPSCNIKHISTEITICPLSTKPLMLAPTRISHPTTPLPQSRKSTATIQAHPALRHTDMPLSNAQHAKRLTPALILPHLLRHQRQHQKTRAQHTTATPVVRAAQNATAPMTRIPIAICMLTSRLGAIWCNARR